jgi:hypothetical protein
LESKLSEITFISLYYQISFKPVGDKTQQHNDDDDDDDDDDDGNNTFMLQMKKK